MSLFKTSSARLWSARIGVSCSRSRSRIQFELGYRIAPRKEKGAHRCVQQATLERMAERNCLTTTDCSQHRAEPWTLAGLIHRSHPDGRRYCCLVILSHISMYPVSTTHIYQLEAEWTHAFVLRR